MALSPREKEEQTFRQRARLQNPFRVSFLLLFFLGLPEQSYLTEFSIFSPALSFLSGDVHAAITSAAF